MAGCGLQNGTVFDPEDNPFLADFYKEKPGSAFRAQFYFLFERHQRMLEAQQSGAAPLVSDFLFEKDKIFAYINLDNEELKLYERYFGMFAAALAPPDLVIYLQATPEVLRERIARKKGLVLRKEDELHQTIGRNIREMRKARQLTLKQMSRRTKLSVSLLSQIERAESSASVSSLFKIATALDVRITELFGQF